MGEDISEKWRNLFFRFNFGHYDRSGNAKDLRIKELERLLEDERLRSLAYSTMIDVAEEELGVPIRKKSGPKQSKG